MDTKINARIRVAPPMMPPTRRVVLENVREAVEGIDEGSRDAEDVVMERTVENVVNAITNSGLWSGMNGFKNVPVR